MKPIGESSWLLSFDDADELTACRRALLVQRALESTKPPGLIETVVASRTLLVLGEIDFDPSFLSELEREARVDVAAAPREVVLPVCFDGEDLGDVAARCGLSTSAYVEAVTSIRFTVGWIGFLPGFPYLLGLPRGLQAPRRGSPRASVPAGSVAVAAAYAGIYPASSPGGWNLIGRTDAVRVDIARESPSLLAPGDTVRWVRA
jgi:KipI family sensor histidine kinase inhibitor